MSRIAGLMCVLMVLFLFAGAATAADDPTGTWKWEMTFGDQKREMVADAQARWRNADRLDARPRRQGEPD